jgi:hypothetical protein
VLSREQLLLFCFLPIARQLIVPTSFLSQLFWKLPQLLKQPFEPRHLALVSLGAPPDLFVTFLSTLIFIFALAPSST